MVGAKKGLGLLDGRGQDFICLGMVSLSGEQYCIRQGVVPSATSGFDAHKRVNGRKRHILADTLVSV